MADGGESKTKIIFDDATVVKQKLADKGRLCHSFFKSRAIYSLVHDYILSIVGFTML